MTTKKKILYSLIVFAVLGLLVEGLSYLTLALLPDTFTGKRSYRKAYTNSGLYPGLNPDYFQENEDAFSLVFDYYRHFRLFGPYNGEYINLDENGFRLTMPEVKNPRSCTGFFGGSTMVGVGAENDQVTIPSLYAKLNSNNRISVKNYGVGAYNNTQEMITFLQLVGKECLDTVIFYDGVNDALTGYREVIEEEEISYFLAPNYIASALEKKIYDEALVPPRPFRKVLNEKVATVRLYDTIRKRMKGIQYVSENLSDEAKNADFEQIRTNPARYISENEKKQARRIVELYAKNKRIIESVSLSYKVTPYFVLQPMLFTKKTLSKYERAQKYFQVKSSVAFQLYVYELFRKQFSSSKNFIDLSAVFDDVEETIYLDDHHMPAKGNRAVVEALHSRLSK